MAKFSRLRQLPPVLQDAEQRLAERLRVLQRGCGRSYSQLAATTDVSASTLKRAASGAAVPKLNTVLDFVQACGGTARDEDDLRHLWRAARRATRTSGKLFTARAQYIRDRADLSGALVEMYEWAAAPPLREMQRRAGDYGVLPHSQVHRIVRRRALPASRRQFLGYLRACEIDEFHHEAWLQAWDKVMTGPQEQVTETLSAFVQQNSGLQQREAKENVSVVMGRRLARIWADMTERERRAALRAFALNVPGRLDLPIQAGGPVAYEDRSGRPHQ